MIDMMTADAAGLAFVRGLRDGALTPPPMIGLVPARIAEANPGKVVMEATPGPRHDNGAGMAHGGWAMTLLDTAMGLAVRTLLDGDRTCVTTDLTVRFHKPARPGQGPYQIIAQVLVEGGRGFTTLARIESIDGVIHASATGAFQALALPTH